MSLAEPCRENIGVSSRLSDTVRGTQLELSRGGGDCTQFAIYDHMQIQTTEPFYALGHTSSELDRLIEQSRLLNELTEHVFRHAGLKPGMDVLDIGCGAGDVSLLAARMVGPIGSVIGVDKSIDAIATAFARANRGAVENVTFIPEDLESLDLACKFDAIVGRLVLMYQPDPAETIRKICRHLRPGGLVIFQEGVFTGVRSIPESPVISRAIRLLQETFQRCNSDLEMGYHLHQTFLRAGLRSPKMIMETRVENSEKEAVFHLLANTLRSLLPVMVNLQIATEEEVDIDTLALRMQKEIEESNGIIVMPHFVGAWSNF